MLSNSVKDGRDDETERRFLPDLDPLDILLGNVRSIIKTYTDRSSALLLSIILY